MYTNEYAKFQQVAVTAAQAAGQLIEQAFTKDKNIEFKGKLDLVTATDKDCELIIFNSIREAFPEHKFIGEEGSAAQGFTSHLTDAPTWSALLGKQSTPTLDSMCCMRKPIHFLSIPAGW